MKKYLIFMSIFFFTLNADGSSNEKIINLNINKVTYLSEYTKSNNELIKSIQKKFSHIL